MGCARDGPVPSAHLLAEARSRLLPCSVASATALVAPASARRRRRHGGNELAARWVAAAGRLRGTATTTTSPGPAAEERKHDAAGVSAVPTSCADQQCGEDRRGRLLSPFVAFLPRRASRQSENSRASCARCQAPGMPPRKELAVLQSREDATRPAGTRGVDGGDALLFGRAASRLATGTASRETHRRAASRPANLRSYAREWLLFRRKRGFPCAACSIAFICCGPQFRPKTLCEAPTSFPFLCPTATMLFFLL